MHPLFNHVAPYRCLLPTMHFLWKISKIQACLCVVVGHGFVSISPAFMRSSASHPAGPHGRLARIRSIGPHCVGAGGFDTIWTAVCNRCDSSTACRLCRLCLCCIPTPPCLFGGVLPYFEVTGHPVLVSSLGFKCPDGFIWNCSYIVYPSKMNGPFRDNCLRYY